MPVPGVVTKLLRRHAGGDRNVEEELFGYLYDSLHEIAARRIRAEQRNHTIQPTALIHEAYIALLKAEGVEWSDRNHFFAVASRVMRRILIDYARGKAAYKRKGGRRRVDLEETQAFSLDDPEFMIALDESLDRLKEKSERACQVVEMRAFAGLSLHEIASSLGVSERTVKRDWTTAKLRLYQDLYGGSGTATATLG